MSHSQCPTSPFSWAANCPGRYVEGATTHQCAKVAEHAGPCGCTHGRAGYWWGDLIPRYDALPCASGLLLLPKGLPEDARHFAGLLAQEAGEKQPGLPWTLSASPALLAAARTYWARVAPGWLTQYDQARGAHVPATDDQIAALLNRGVANNVEPMGGVVLPADRRAAWECLQARPDLAARTVRAYLGFAEYPLQHRLDALVFELGSGIARDSDHFQGRESRGESAAAYVLGLPWKEALQEVRAQGGASDLDFDQAGGGFGRRQRPEALVTGFVACTHRGERVEAHGLPPVAVSTVARPRGVEWEITRDE